MKQITLLILITILLTSCGPMTLDEIKAKQERCIAGNTTPVFIDDGFGERIICNRSSNRNYNNKEDNKQIEFCREHNMNYEYSAWDGTINCIKIK